MSAPSSQPEPVAAGQTRAEPGVSVTEIDASCRLPLLLMFVSAAAWLVIGSVFALIASIKFHSPAFLADCSWLTYGRVRPAYYNSVLYGFCLQAGLGVGLWLIARLGRTVLSNRWMITLGAKLWNLGVTVGVLGILAGDSTGYEILEMPRYAALILFLGYLFIGVYGLITFHQRRYFPLFVSQWFLVATLFWFPWIYSTAYLLLSVFPVRGVTQAVVAFWYSANLQTVLLGSLGLAAAFYLVPKLTRRDLLNHYLALFTFWTLLFFGGWTGIPQTAPVPAWMPALSTSAAFLMLIPLLTVGMNLYGTIGRVWVDRASHFSLRFICAGIAAYLAAGLMSVLSALPEVSRFTGLTWFSVAKDHLHFYGFFALIMFGAIYYIAPQLTGIEFPWPKFVRAHLVLAMAGILLIVLPLALGGILQGVRLADPAIPFDAITRSALPFLRASTLGDLSLAAGHVLFLLNLAGMVRKFSQARITTAITEVTQDIKPAEAGA
jgi:cytochrome c oxidase cbb3-type subunit 1